MTPDPTRTGAADDVRRAGERTAPHPLPISPDCQAGKCSACSFDAWDYLRDVLTDCGHDCHRGVTR